MNSPVVEADAVRLSVCVQFVMICVPSLLSLPLSRLVYCGVANLSSGLSVTAATRGLCRLFAYRSLERLYCFCVIDWCCGAKLTMTILTCALSVHGVWSVGGAPVWGVAEVYPWHCSSDVCGDVLFTPVRPVCERGVPERGVYLCVCMCCVCVLHGRREIFVHQLCVFLFGVYRISFFYYMAPPFRGKPYFFDMGLPFCTYVLAVAIILNVQLQASIM